MRLKLRVARETKRCANCNRRIEHGEKYFDTNVDGKIYLIYGDKYCLDCIKRKVEISKNLYQCELKNVN